MEYRGRPETWVSPMAISAALSKHRDNMPAVRNPLFERVCTTNIHIYSKI
jgi:hypothetical protein